MVADSIEIKSADKNDAQLLSDLSTITFIETYHRGCPEKDIIDFIDENFNKEAIAEELNNPEDFYFIVYVNKFPAGYMRIGEDYDEYPLREKYNAIHLKRIYVLKNFQGKGIGAALMKFALAFASVRNYELLWLGVWEYNKKAMLFYEKWGFEDRNLPYNFYTGSTTHTDYWLIKFIEKS